jgi:alpha-mannosidase
MTRARARYVFLTFFLGLTANARGGDLETIVHSLPPTLRSGYASSLGGGTIVYHSVNPHARDALLARTTDGAQYVEWQSDPAPTPVPKRGVVFAWLAALSGSKGVHSFEMAVNGKEMFRFSTLSDSTHKTWKESGPDGSTLTFCATEADRFGDLFGYMFLVLPAGSVTPGAPLRLRAKGEAAGSSAWFMVFEHRLADAARIRALPALVRTSGGVMQPVSVDIEHYGNPGKADIRIEGGETLSGRLGWGFSSFRVRSRPADLPGLRRVKVTLGSTVIIDTPIMMEPVRRRTLYLLPHSHTDIGYSAYQAVVEKNHMRYIDEAIDIARKSAEYPEGARFKWNIEVMWPLESYVSAASAGQKNRLARAIANGWIGLNGLYSNLLTGLCRPEELFHSTDYARKAAAGFGVPVRAAMISDIPAYSSSIVPALGRAGIRYLSSGPNYVPSLPDGGDRIGFALKTWGDRPFYWVSASGQDTLLFWMAGRGYSWFHGLNMGELGGAQSSEIFDYVQELDSRNYPYDMVMVRYTVGGDNGPPDPNLPDVIRAWNEEYASPRFAIATTQELFENFEQKYGSSLPVRTGDLTPYWEDGAASTARELAENRQTAEDISQTETLYAIFNPSAYAPDAVCGAWRGVHLFDEHTWGAANSISEPDSPDVKAQWEYKLAFLRSAENGEKTLRSAVVKPFPPGPVGAVDIVNTGSWPRTDLVLLPKNISLAGLRARDSGGRPVPAQRVSSGETALLVKEVPPFGFLRVRFEQGEPFTPPAGASVSGTTLRSGGVEATLNPVTGVISRITSGGENLVDSTGGAGLNQFVYVPGRDPHRALSDSNVSVRVIDNGPLVAAISITSIPPGGKRLTRTVRMAGGIGRLDIIDTLWKSRVREKESVHFGFPFHIPGATTRIGNAFSIVRPDSDQLPGSCRDYFCAQHWVDVSNDGTGVLIDLPDAPLVEMGTMTDETLNRGGVRSWKEKAGGGSRLYSYVMNNYWHTNYKADQEGETVFRYSLIPHAAFDPPAAERSGIEASQPLIVKPPGEGVTPGTSLLSIEPSSVIATALKPAAEGKGWILHLYNAGGSSTGVRLAWHGAGRGMFYSSDLTERRGAAPGFPILIPSSGIAIVRIE